MAATQREKAHAFHALHQRPRAFVMANAWDAGTACILGGLGFPAIGTSSWAAGNVLGRGDHGITREEVMAHCRSIASATDLPVSPDLENGFGATTKDVAETYRQAADAGVVGASIEDAIHGADRDALYSIDEATERVAAALDATSNLGFPFVLTARADGFLHGHTDLEDIVRRLQAYEKAGADVLMAPGLPDLGAVKAVCASLNKPFNFMVGIPGRSFSVSELEAAGVRRISLASSLYSTAMSGLVAAAKEVQEKGTFGYVDTSMGCWDIDRYMSA